MIQHNVCYHSLVKDSREIDADTEVFTSPIGAKFVSKNVRTAVLPQLLEDLLTARRHAQKEAKSAGENLRRVLDARQKAFKVG